MRMLKKLLACAHAQEAACAHAHEAAIKRKHLQTTSLAVLYVRRVVRMATAGLRLILFLSVCKKSSTAEPAV